MAKKIKKPLSTLMILALIGLMVGAGFGFKVFQTRAAEEATTSGDVNNVAPSVSSVNLTPSPIVLTANTTTTVTCVGTITDENGGDDIVSCTSTIYRSGVGASCSANNNNCYIVSSGNCTLGTVSGNDRNATVTADIYFHADPTDAGAAEYSAQTWQCQITGTDAGPLTGSGTDTSPPELNTLNAVSVSPSITYDALNPGAYMASTTAAVNATTTGNAAIDIQLKGINMTSGANSIAVGNQRYSTTTDDAWANGTALTVDYVPAGMELIKPTTSPSNSTDIVYWGWLVPSGTPAGTYTGTNYFNPIAD